MKEKLISALILLLKVKSIITFLTFGAFFYLSVTEKISVDNFMLILGMIATYFLIKIRMRKEVLIVENNKEKKTEVVEEVEKDAAISIEEDCEGFGEEK